MADATLPSEEILSELEASALAALAEDPEEHEGIGIMLSLIAASRAVRRVEAAIDNHRLLWGQNPNTARALDRIEAALTGAKP